ncbi:MAG: molybdenum cofactor biosynthesis protein MoaE [Xanthomonadales bacterium]|nr:molybdenum cofactor biosynthesis protein MoaE [Xanthomonadales bacterium]
MDATDLHQALAHAAAGACVCFEGWVRDHHQGRQVRGLTYQAYTELAEREGEAIMAEACAQFDLRAARAVHRVGDLAVGELAVWVGVSSDHRDAAFTACRWIIDALKARVPIWKHEHYVDGSALWQHPDGPR